MEYLIKIGISKEVIQEIKDKSTKGEIESIINCMGRLESSILYLRELGIKNDSIASYSVFCQNVIGIFMIIFGINFTLYYLIRCD